MLLLPHTLLPAFRRTADDLRQDDADVEDKNRPTEQIFSPTPHRPPPLHLGENDCDHNTSGPVFIHGPTINSAHHQTYRILPIIAGVLIPLSVLLSIPSLTSHWLVQTDGDNVTVATHPNPLLLIVSMSLSVACGVSANICLVLRFAERMVKKMTLLCIIFLLITELINIPVVIMFATIHRYDDGFIYGQSFWMTVCSTVISTVTNITLIIDYSRTKNFTKCGSGLTHKQRSLVIIIIILLCYVTLGSLVQTFVLKITFLDALYFTVVSIETIGFGDIYPSSTGERIFIALYISCGILNLGLAVALTREAILEAAAAGFRERVKSLRARQRERHIRVRWKAAVKWRLQAKNIPLWVADDRVSDNSRHHYSQWWTSAKQSCSLLWRKLSFASKDHRSYAPRHKHLNLNALTEAQLEAAALEAGAPLADLLPSRLDTLPNDAEHIDVQSQPIIQPQPLLTHMRIGGMVSLLGQFAIAFTHGYANADTENGKNKDDVDHEECTHEGKAARERLGVPFTRTLTMQDEDSFLEALEAEEKIASIARLSIACFLFLVFWGVGSVIFWSTEGWDFGTAVYFCFIAFSTVGYGDFAPKTQAGRSIFVVWALLGVATMTILISILTDAYSTSYKSAIKTEMIKAKSLTENASIAFTRQRSLESRTMGTATEFSLYFPQSPSSPVHPSPSQFHSVPLSQIRSATLPSSRNDHIIRIPSVPVTQKVKCVDESESQERTRENLTALSLEIMRHAEKLKSLLNSAKDSEILEIEMYINQVERTIKDIATAAKQPVEAIGLKSNSNINIIKSIEAQGEASL